MGPRTLCSGVVLLVAVGNVSAQALSGLEMSFEPRTYAFRLEAADLENAYRVDAGGGIQMLANPSRRTIAGESLQVAVSRAARPNGEVRVRWGDRVLAMVIGPDNRRVGPERIGGLPFGLAFLPRDGRAAVGASWSEEFPPPGGAGAGAAVTFRYTLRRLAPTAACPSCVEIAIAASRRFVPGGGLERALADILLPANLEFYTGEQVFAVGSVQFSRDERFVERYRLASNPSLLGAVPIPGLMREIVVARTGAAP